MKKASAFFAREYGAAYPKAVSCLIEGQEHLLPFFGFPAQRWLHLRTTNPIELPFATVKARECKTKGAGSHKAGLALAYKLVSSAERHWRKVHAPHLVALVRAGAKFHNGVLVSEQYQSEHQRHRSLWDHRLMFGNPQHLTISRKYTGRLEGDKELRF